MARVFLSYASRDRATAEVLGRLLQEEGLTTFWDWSFSPGTDIASALAAELENSDVSLVLWSRHASSSSFVRSDVDQAAVRNKLLLVRLDDCELPVGIVEFGTVDLREWRGRYSDPLLIDRLRNTILSRYARATSNLSVDPFEGLELGSASSPSLPELAAGPVADSDTFPPRLPHDYFDLGSPSASSADPLSDLSDMQLGSVSAPRWQRELPPQAAEPRETAESRTSLRSPERPAAMSKVPGLFENVLNRLRPLWTRKPLEPVLLSASAPRECEPGCAFTAALVAYVAASRTSAHQKLASLGEPGDRRIDDVAASAWIPGAPVTVRLSAEGASVSPNEVRFEWSGNENLAAFKVRADARQACVEASLCFEVFVADVLVAFIPLQVRLRSGQVAGGSNHVQSRVPRSAFASYASKDAEPVTHRLSTLSRWSPGLDIFQDCLDLKPGERFKPQLAKQIATRDVFMLFWSRSAATSQWVKWEYTTAIEKKGLDAILPMPLEDPAIAPPPPELAEQHQRDRYMLAGYGLARIREMAGRNRP